MKKALILLVATVVVFAALPSAAPAQLIPQKVIDLTHIAKTVENFRQMVRQYERQAEELEEAVKQVEAMTGVSGMHELFNSIEDIAGRRFVPQEWGELLDLLEAYEDPPEELEQVVEIYEELKELYEVVEREDYTALDPESPEALAFERRAKTNLAALATAEVSFEKTNERLAHLEELIFAQAGAETLKASADLQARATAQLGLILAEMARLQTLQIQQQAAMETQRLVQETNWRRQIRYETPDFEN